MRLTVIFRGTNPQGDDVSWSQTGFVHIRIKNGVLETLSHPTQRGWTPLANQDPDGRWTANGFLKWTAMEIV